ncbi:MAG: hypothetical protein ACP5IZ_11970, partial [Thermoprotei archaeon]
IKLLVKGVVTGNITDRLFRKEELDSLEVINADIDFFADPREVFLAIESMRFRYASLFDPLLAINVSKIDPLPFQIEAVYGYILKQPH